MIFAGFFVYLVVPELKGLSLEVSLKNYPLSKNVCIPLMLIRPLQPTPLLLQQVDEMYQDKKLLPWKTTQWQPQTGRDTNRNAIGLSQIVNFNKNKKRVDA